MPATERQAYVPFSFSLGNDTFEHPRVGTVRVSTVAFAEPPSYGIMAAPNACYEAETCIFVGPWGSGRLAGRICYPSIDRAREAHPQVLAKARRGGVLVKRERTGEE